MLKHKMLALAIGLMLTGVGLRADDARQEAKPDDPVAQQTPPAGAIPQLSPTNQPGISVNPPGQEQPVTAPTTPTPTAPGVPLTPTDTQPAPDANAPNTDQQQNPPNQQQPVQPDQQQPVQPDQQPAQPDQQAPPANQPNQQQPEQPDTAQPSLTDQTAPVGAGSAGAEIDTEGLAVSLNPLQQFVSHQNHEVGMLSHQMDVLKAANRQDAVMAFYHMIRDHTLVSDAAQNVLARRREIARPFQVRMDEPMAQTPEDIIRQQVQHHEQALARTREMLANASTPEERSILQRAENATNKHLNWLRALDQGQAVRIGYFAPTVPLSRIAGYRQQSGVRQANRSGRQMRARRAQRSQRSWRARRAR